MARWQATDWGSNPFVVWDDGVGPLSEERIVATAHRMLSLAARCPADYYLFLEDDLLFNRHLRKNVLSWPPLREGWLWMGSLYNPSHPARDPGGVVDRWGQPYFRVARGAFWGTQAMLLSRKALAVVLRDWAMPGTYDLKVAAIAECYGNAPLIHSPSLVQQVPVTSTWGGSGHRAVDFDPFFLAPWSECLPAGASR
jgi:hypothetical protein